MGNAQKITNIPTNLVMGFLGVGKTTAILDLIKQKPKDENWAVLVNEFGKIGIDGAIYADAGVVVQEIAGGCLCCAVGVPFQISINRLLKEARPDRLIIEPTGLGHPKKVLDMLVSGANQQVLDVRASICLLDPEKLKDDRYTTHQNFIDQIALSDVLVANKMDLADQQATNLFHQFAEISTPKKALISETQQGQLDISWLDINRNPQRKAFYPNAHQMTSFPVDNHIHGSLINEADGYQSYGETFSAQICFDYELLNKVLNKLNLERIKGILKTDQGWFVVNGTGNTINYIPTQPCSKSRIETISKDNNFQVVSNAFSQCKIADNKNGQHY